MPTVPATHHAKSGDVHVAGQAVGEGPIDLVPAPGWVPNLEVFRGNAGFAACAHAPAAVSRLKPAASRRG